MTVVFRSAPRAGRNAATASLRRRVARAQWYAHRLARMSPWEVGYRVVEQCKRRALRRYKPDFRCPRAAVPVVPGLRDRLLRTGAQALPMTSWRELFHAAAEGRYSRLGQEWPAAIDGRGRWHIDPVSGRSWPGDAYCFAIPYRDAKEMGDVKYVWELNRLQYLQPIAAYAVRSGDAAAADFCKREIASWIDANPPYRGVNWASGIELALRTISLIVVASLLGRDAFTREERERLLSCLAAHGFWLDQFPSRFSSANNHLVAEAAGLFILGSLATELPRAEQWRRYGRETLEREIAKQIYPDGVGAEQSPTYAAFSLEWWVLASRVADSVEAPFSARYRQRLAAAGRFLRCLLDDRDHHPRIGDDDEGRVIYSPGTDEAYVPCVLQALAAVTADRTVAPNHAYRHLWRAFHPPIPEPVPPASGMRTFAQGGYSVVREDSPGGEFLLVFDHGPLGYLSIAAHGHADTLGLWLHLGGRPVLVDAGTFLYHAGGNWRDHFRGSAAHNTLVVEHTDSSRIVGPFNWSRKAAAELVESIEDGDGWQLTAEHDGFRSAFGVRHRRSLARTRADAFEVVDSLIGSSAPRNVEVGFLVHPDLSVTEQQQGEFCISDARRRLLTVSYTGPLRGCIQRGQSAPPRGWYSARFGRREAASRIAFCGKLAPGQLNRVKFHICA